MHIECAYVITFVFLMERIGGHVTDIVKILWIFTFIVLFVNVLYLIYIYIIFFTIKYDLYIADPSSMRDACQIWT